MLCVLLAFQLVLQVGGPEPARLVGDEPYYLNKADYLVRNGRLPKISPKSEAILAGQALGYSDTRPPGYPVFLALVRWVTPTHWSLRRSCTAVQALAMAATLLALYLTMCRWVASTGARVAIAALLGIQPWSFEYVGNVYPDPLLASLVGMALLIAPWFWERRGGVAFLVGFALALSLTILLRPEMLVVVPIILGLAIGLKDSDWRSKVRYLSVAALLFFAVVSVQVAYRWYFAGRVEVVGPFLYDDKEAYDWVHTWFGTEHEMYDFVFALTNKTARIEDLPSRAFATVDEREQIDQLTKRIVQEGYTWSNKNALEAVVEQKVASNWFLFALLPRLWRTSHLWLNVETNGRLLELLAAVPRVIRKGLLLGLLLAKTGCLAGAAWVTGRAVGRFRADVSGPMDHLTILMSAFVVSRTALIGLFLGWGIHRYALAAWPPLLWCAGAAVAEIWPRSSQAGAR